MWFQIPNKQLKTTYTLSHTKGDKVMYDCRKFYVTFVRLNMHPRYGSAMVDSDRYALLLAVTICKMNIMQNEHYDNIFLYKPWHIYAQLNMQHCQSPILTTKQ